MHILLGILGVIFAIIYMIWEEQRPGGTARLNNGPGTQALDVNDLMARVQLASEGEFTVNFFRQSGNPHQDSLVYRDRNAAISALMSTFRRARVQQVVIMDNTANYLAVRRWFFDHSGRAGGKKLAHIEIRRAGNAGVVRPTTVLAPAISASHASAIVANSIEQPATPAPYGGRPPVIDEFAWADMQVEILWNQKLEYRMVYIVSTGRQKHAPYVFILWQKEVPAVVALLERIERKDVTTSGEHVFQGGKISYSIQPEVGSVELRFFPKNKRARGHSVPMDVVAARRFAAALVALQPVVISTSQQG